MGAGIAVEPRTVACFPGSRDLSHIGPVARVASLAGLGGPPRLEYRQALPAGAGYAASGSLSVAASLAIGASLGFSVGKSLVIAHVAEVEELTGLGDVLAISCGVGLVVRWKPGAPGTGVVECFQIPPKISILSMEYGSLETRRLVASMEKHKERAFESLKRLERDPGFYTFIEEARKFTLEASLLEGLGHVSREEVEKTPGLVGYYAKKRVLVAFVESQLVHDAAAYLAGLTGIRPRLLEPSRGGPEVWSLD
ncbi:MAG: hypothetical protein LRS43_03395 [Desulfurococcales archaeon]|nr:hypothetical protein [Desulfurococcales archaeon]